MLKVTIADTDWTINAQAAEYAANGETPERARELADTQEAWLINNAREGLPADWRYVGDGAFEGRHDVFGGMQRVVDAILSLRIEASDFATEAPSE